LEVKYCKKNNISINQLDPTNFKQLKTYFEDNQNELYLDAMSTITQALKSEGMDVDLEGSTLQKIAASFRRVYLTNVINKLLLRLMN
jgi:uncharacterized protein (DUF302 family)